MVTGSLILPAIDVALQHRLSEQVDPAGGDVPSVRNSCAPDPE